MYDPLIKIGHSNGECSFVRSSLIMSVFERGDEWHVDTDNTTYNIVTNPKEIIDLVNSVEDRNEQSQLLK